VASATQPDEVRGHVLPVLPLALLETVRDQDRPVEILEAEDLSVSLPRRLGLTGIVSTQIQRYEAAVASGSRVPVPELTSLLQLVLRRPDAEPILRETGRRVARLRLGEHAPFMARVLRRFSRLVFIPIRSAAKRLLRGIAGEAVVEMAKPLVVRIRPSYTANLTASACVLYTGALEELIRLYMGQPGTIVHQHCTARGDAVCEWRIQN
jgi:predicted hydrocarbon binding protein